MNIRIRYFAAFREVTGIASEDIETRVETAAALFAECTDRYPGLQSWSASQVAVNDELADWGRVLTDGDEVLFFPPVAGG
jgi:molybdopterin converting factor subunit 1